LASRGAELDRLHRRIRVRRYRSLFLAWLARWFRSPRPARLEPLPRVAAGQVAITSGGHATALIRYSHATIVVDPMLGRWLGGIRRAVEPGLAPADLSTVDVVLISHRHTDHFHMPTLGKLPRTASLVVPAGTAAVVSSLGFARVIELSPGSEVELCGVGITATPIHHGDHPRARGLAYVVAGKGPSVYVYADGAYFSGFAEVGERYAPDIALLPIGGYWPRGLRRRHLSPLDALYAFEDLGARVLIPIHHGAFALSYERLDEPARWLSELATARGLASQVCLLAPGQSALFASSTAAQHGTPGAPWVVGVDPDRASRLSDRDDGR